MKPAAKKRKYLKISLISLFSLVLLLLVSFTVATWLLLTPERLTPLVKKQSKKFIPYQTEIGEVELTIFRTFPRFGIRLSDFTIVSPAHGAVSDTLLNLEELTGVIDINKYRKEGKLFVNELFLSGGSVNVFSDSLGRTNYDLFLTVATSEDDASEVSEDSDLNFHLENIEFDDLDLAYTDLASGMKAAVQGLKAGISGDLDKDNVQVLLDVKDARVDFQDKEEKYLENADVKFRIPAEVSLSKQQIRLKDAFFSLNGLEIGVNGSLHNDLSAENISTDLQYELDSWNIEDLLALIPPEYLSGTGIEKLSGTVSGEGKISGAYNDSLMPALDIRFNLQDGALNYSDFPFPLDEMDGNVHFVSGLNALREGVLEVENFHAATPHSSFTASGTVDRLFEDLHCDLTTKADVLLDEFHEFIPAEPDLRLNGKVQGEIKSEFLLSQLTNLEFEKIKLSGSARLSGFRMVYDSLSLYTGHSGIRFALPNADKMQPNTGFASFRIESDDIYASQEGVFTTSLRNSNIYLETSDVRDTTSIPYLFCIYRSDSLRAGMDTIDIGMNKTYGNVSVFPSENDPMQPGIRLAYSTYDLKANTGNDSYYVEDFLVNTTVISDQNQDEVFLRWLPQGEVRIINASVDMEALTRKLELPSLHMDFDPENFNIHEGKLLIDQSDYRLKGKMKNVHSYFRGDSLLRADFEFSSQSTNLDQLMALTSGLGAEEEAGPAQDVEDENLSTPYMVPLGVDLNLHANINQLVSGRDTAVNIFGNVRIKDGVLVLDDLIFTTPAADMQLTAMYRTPRKNHLYLGLDYHMLDVEISRLLQMIPDIDTLMPMLRSFSGTGEFHIAAETYLDSAYNIKKSTLRGASSIKGEDLVLMDGETFSEIAKKLHFSRKAENRVDSLSAEFTIFREEIDIYPFLIVMDRYKAIVGGRHNFDMSFDYHISLVDSPLPVRLGIDIQGNEEDLKYRPAAARYAKLYRPVSRREVENRQLELRKRIREALIEKVEKQNEDPEETSVSE